VLSGGRVMRYFLLESLPKTLAITTLAFGVGMTTRTGRGVSTGGATTGFPACFPGAAIEAIAMAAIATAADDHLAVTASTVVEAGRRIHRR